MRPFLLSGYSALWKFAASSAGVGLTAVSLQGLTDTLSTDDEHYGLILERGAAAFRKAEKLFNSESFRSKRGWRKEAVNREGDIVYSRMTTRGKMVTISTTITGEVSDVMAATWRGVESLPAWNSHINYAYTLKTFTDHADVVTYGNDDILLVSGRDFVTVRMYRPMANGDGFIMTSTSVELPEYSEQKGKIRAHLHLGAAWLRPDPSAPSERTIYDVVLMADFKGYLPRVIVDQLLPRLALINVEDNKRHFKQLAMEADSFHTAAKAKE